MLPLTCLTEVDRLRTVAEMTTYAQNSSNSCWS